MFIKRIQDYYEEVHKKFPELTLKDIKTILNFGWRSFYLHNSYGGDVRTTSKDFNFYCGRFTHNSLRHFQYYLSKLKVKANIMYKRKCKEWDGYYYFALSDSQYQQYLNQIHSAGRPKKYFSFPWVLLFKNPDECKIDGWNKRYIFRVKSPIDAGYKSFRRNCKLKSPELVEVRNSFKFDSILTQNKNFKYI